VRIIYGYRSIEEPLGPLVMTLGTFDGLHVGHRAIIERVVDRGRKTGLPSLVYSFYPPPWRVLGRGAHPYLILTLHDKIDLLNRMGLDLLVTEEFTPDLQSLSHEDFAGEVLEKRLQVKEIHVGYDFRFGRDRGGDWQYLKRRFAGTGALVRPHGAVRLDGEVVGCSLVRRLVCEGQVAEAAPLLGRWHFVRGAVVRGRGRGGGIGFPTLNVETQTELVPPPGVYGVAVQIGNDPALHPGAANLGFRPTFAEKEFALEVHLLDFSGDLYGERVLVHFVRRLREERRFSSVDALLTQIRKDVDDVRGLLPFAPPRAGALSWDPKPT
jgi:riboflavin kinase/FMN adenylyltransferase